MKFSRWNRRAVAWVGGLFIAAILGLAAYDIVQGYRRTLDNAGHELEGQARLIAEQTARSLQAVDVVLRHLAQQHRQGAFDGMKPRDLHNYLREQIGRPGADRGAGHHRPRRQRSRAFRSSTRCRRPS